MKIRKIGILDANNDFQLVLDTPGDFATLVTNFEVHEDSVTVGLPLVIGKGPSARLIRLEVPISQRVLKAQSETPMNLDPSGVVRADKNRYLTAHIFKNQVFLVSDEFANSTYFQEAALLIKKYVYEDEARLKRLSLEVEAIERISSTVGVYRRTSIPEVVKLVVWERDEGKCVRCGSTQTLHFDHIIPVIKGGSNSEDNIQLLCSDCNFAKSDKIAF